MYVGCPCGQSAHVDRSGFFGTWWFEDTSPRSIADVVLVALTRTRGRYLSAVEWFVLSACGEEGLFRMSDFLGFWHPALLG